jgi:hypothetical protein
VLATVNGPWDLAFPSHWGAPAHVTLPVLQSWIENPDPGVKYFSGTATYTKTLQAPADLAARGGRILLDLGVARDLAQVTLNGRVLPLLWKAPYRVDVTDVLRPGANDLVVAVTNEWTNRQIGDKLGPPEKRVLTSEPVRAFSPRPVPLADSGLIGPVTFVAEFKR